MKQQFQYIVFLCKLVNQIELKQSRLNQTRFEIKLTNKNSASPKLLLNLPVVIPKIVITSTDLSNFGYLCNISLIYLQTYCKMFIYNSTLMCIDKSSRNFYTKH